MASPQTSSADLTRHQLDELDALLQRMLNLPLAGPPVVAPPPPSVQNWQPGPAPVVTVEPEPEVESESADVISSAERFQYPEPEPRTLRGVDAPALPREELVEPEPETEPELGLPVMLADVQPEPEPEEVPAAAPDTDTVPLLAWPVVAANAVLEAGLGCFGPVGRVFTTPAVKQVLGVTGVLMGVGASVWVARGLGLIAL